RQVPTLFREAYRYRRRAVRRNGFRFGIVEGACEGAQSEVQRAFTASLDILKEIGTLEEVQLPEFPYTEVASIILDGEIYAAFDDFIASGRTAELTATKAHGHRLAAAVLPAHDYIRGATHPPHHRCAFRGACRTVRCAHCAHSRYGRLRPHRGLRLYAAWRLRTAPQFRGGACGIAVDFGLQRLRPRRTADWTAFRWRTAAGKLHPGCRERI